MNVSNIYKVGESQESSDYIGFTFNGVHSSELGIKRTSDGSRFNENLLPTMQDKTVQVPGGDGAYYFGSYYTQRVFNIPFAFDSLTEAQFARLKTHFGDKGIHDLIFDEAPYKVYSAKVTGSATIKHIPFAEGDTNRVYKGEGSIQFTCYNPFARSKFKWLDKYDNANKAEWAVASGMKESKGNYDTNVNQSFQLYNPGDLEADFIFRIKFGNDSNTIPAATISLGDNYLSWEKIPCKDSDYGVYIDSKLNLLYGYIANRDQSGNLIGFEKTDNIYNEYLTEGAFFKIPKGESTLSLSNMPSWSTGLEISYDYLYF